MSRTDNVSMWGPPLLAGLILVAYGQNMVGIGLLDHVPGLANSLTMAGYTLGVASLLGVFGVLFAVVVVASESSSEDTGRLGLLEDTASGIRAAAFVGIVGILYWMYTQAYATPRELAMDLWWVVPAGLIGYMTFVYLQNRREVASGTTALNRSQRDIKRSMKGWSELVTGVGALLVTAALAVITGFMVGIGAMAEPLLGVAGELAYLGTVLLGYVSLGGEWRYAWIIPELSAIQWVSITLIMGAVAMVVRDP